MITFPTFFVMGHALFLGGWLPRQSGQLNSALLSLLKGQDDFRWLLAQFEHLGLLQHTLAVVADHDTGNIRIEFFSIPE